VEVWLLITFVGASRGHLCDSTAFLFFDRRTAVPRRRATAGDGGHSDE